MDYLMGIDIGTTHIKVGIYNINGKKISLSRRVNNLYKDKSGNSYYNPEELVETVYSCINEAIDNFNGEISIICVAGMAESGLMIDKEGEPLFGIIPWFDERNVKELDWFRQNFDPLYIYQNTGLKIQAKSSLLKIMWIKENERHIYDKCAYWLNVEDYVVYCLTEEIATEISLANRTMAMDIKKSIWHKDIINKCGIREDIFPQILHSGEPIGKINKEVSSKTRLKEGIPVSIGGHDHLCAAFALGAVEENMMLNSMGTAESLVQIKRVLEATKENLELGFSVGRYVVKDLFYLIGGINNSGRAITWFGKNVLGFSNKNMYDRLKSHEKRMGNGATQILFLPHLTGSSVPVLDNNSKASFIGLKPQHTSSDLVKSVYEGLSYEFRLLYETMNKSSKNTDKGLIVTGGSIKNDCWINIKSNVLNTQLHIPCVEEAVCMGAAMLGGLGLGIYSSVNDVLKNVNYDIRTVKPVHELSREYDYIYNCCYKKLYRSIIEINDLLG